LDLGARCTDRGERNAILQTEIQCVWQANVQVDGVPKVWKEMNRQRGQLKLRLRRTATGNSETPLTCLH